MDLEYSMDVDSKGVGGGGIFTRKSHFVTEIIIYTAAVDVGFSFGYLVGWIFAELLNIVSSYLFNNQLLGCNSLQVSFFILVQQ